MGDFGQQCTGQLPFERYASVNDSFSILRPGTTDPLQAYSHARSERRVPGWSGHRRNGHKLHAVNSSRLIPPNAPKSDITREAV